MIKLLILALALPLSSPQTVIDCTRDAEGYCSGGLAKIELTYNDPLPRIHVNVAMGRVTDIILPEDTELLRKAGIGNLKLFNVRMLAKGVIRVVPTAPSGRDMEDTPFLGADTELLIPLNGISINLVFRIAESKKHISEVRFTWEERQQESKYVIEKLKTLKEVLDKRLAKQQKNYQAAVELKADKLLALSFLDRVQCNQWNRHIIVDRQRDSNRLLIMFVNQLCRIGERVMISFRLRNRYRDVFHLKEVKVLADKGRDVKARWVFTGGLEKVTLQMNEEIHGVAYFQVHTPPAVEYTLIVKEDGGKQRVVEIDHIEF